jgi:putative membrane protein
MRDKADYFLLFLKGIGMGVADVIPGVSGGTIAFISGIYEELVNSIKSINFTTLRLLFTGKIATFFKAINGLFLLSVFGGVAVSIFSLAQLMKWLLTNHPIPVWSFFFGLILASTVFVVRSTDRFRFMGWISFVAGILIAYWITSITPVNTPEALWFIFLSGAIGICAMILPGISGAFILLLLGKYLYLMTAVTEFNIPVIVVFVAGAATGLILFSNLLSWLLKNHHVVTIAMLAGFMIGSLNKVWPWKIVELSVKGSHGEIVPLTERNVLPYAYSTSTGNESAVVSAIVFFIVGILLLVVIETIGDKLKRA